MEWLEQGLKQETVENMALRAGGHFDEEQLGRLRHELNNHALKTLVEKALKAGVHFTPDEVVEWTCSNLDDKIILQMALTVEKKYTHEQAEMLHGMLPENCYQQIAKKYRLPTFRQVREREQSKPSTGPGFLGALLGMLTGVSQNGGHKEHKHCGQCDGDCANCPPHYGYRYGRWYYGHGHQHGCEFGGNKGDGSM